MDWVLTAWGRILAGYQPALSMKSRASARFAVPVLAYGDDHLGGDVTLAKCATSKGQA
jgi:hypothetical protein